MINTADIVTTLRAAGLRGGDHLLVHSSLRSVGPIDGGADALIDGLLDVVGTEGTLAMPAFNYSRPPPQPYFDPGTTPGRTGMLCEVFRKRPQSLRSQHPTHSVVAQGPRAAEFLSGHERGHAMGVGSPLDRIAGAGGWILLLGVTHLANSTVHVAETHAGRVKFWWEEGPLPVVKMLMPDGTIAQHTLDPSTSCSMAFNEVEYPLRRMGAIRDVYLGAALSFLLNGRDVIDAVVRTLREVPDAFLCTRPNCRPCTKAREHLKSTGAISK